ncbi:ribonuclease H-like domain-containing protein [Tanacetum coccineum]
MITTHNQALGYKNPFYLKNAQRIKPTLYDGSVISSQHDASLVIDDEETLILEEVNRSKMLTKQNDPMSKEKKVNTTPINYVKLNRLSEDFGLKSSTSASRSQPTGNKKNDRISQTPSSNMKNKVQVQRETQKPENKVYSRRPKQMKSVCSSKKAKIVESKIANNSEPNHLWGSNATNVPSSSSRVNDRLSILFSGTVRFRNDQIEKVMGYGDYQPGKTKSCLWHHRLSHLNFGTLNKLAKDGLVRGLLETDIQEKDKNQSQNDKTEHENGKTVRSQKDQVKVNKKVKVKVNPGKWHCKEHRKPNPKT